MAEVAIVVGKFLWFSPVLVFEGVVVAIAAVVVGIMCFMRRNDDNEETLGCLFGGSVFFVLGLCVIRWISSDCYVSHFLVKGIFIKIALV